MLRRTEPSTVVILLASVISSPLPPFPRRVGRRDGVAKIFRSMFFSVLVCVVFTSHSPGLSRIIYRLQRPFSLRRPFNVACNSFNSTPLYCRYFFESENLQFTLLGYWAKATTRLGYISMTLDSNLGRYNTYPKLRFRYFPEPSQICHDCTLRPATGQYVPRT